jgi:hypothetical protein
MAGIAADERAISALSDEDDVAAGGSLPFRNLFAAGSEAWQQEFPFTGAPSIALGDANTTATSGAGIGLGMAPPPWLAPLLGDRSLSPAEEGVMYARAAIEAYRRAGDEATADAISKAIMPKRGRGQPRKLTDEQVLNLAVDVAEVLCANPSLKGTRAIAIVAKRPQWRGLGERVLRDHFTRHFATYNGLTFEQTIETFREHAIKRVRASSQSAE